jgi:competence protein ComEC
LGALRAARIEELDWIVGSHPHEDHIGGLVDVLREMPVAQAMDPGYNHGTSLQKTYLSLLKEKGVKPALARAGQMHDLGSGARLEVLAPEAPLLGGTEADANNNSIVARLVFGQTEFLFTGDMEEDERERLLRSARPEQLRSDVLKVAHHGSHNGTDSEFLRAVQPDYAVISLAKGNDYGHPHREALDALRNEGCRILRTDERGTLVFTTDGKELRLADAGPPTATPGSKPAPAAAAGKVVGNRSSRVYHAPDCSSLPDRERRQAFASAGKAEAAGYRAHAACVGRGN